MDLATFIAQERDRKSLSFRDLEKRAEDLNHAYIWRLAKGDQAAPSPETIKKLGVALELTERKQRIFALLVKASIDDALYRVMESREDISWEDIETVATMSFRGTRPTTEDEWIKRIELVRELGF
jgi:HTH-type transcriptional regulator, competence development regulator